MLSPVSSCRPRAFGCRDSGSEASIYLHFTDLTEAVQARPVDNDYGGAHSGGLRQRRGRQTNRPTGIAVSSSRRANRDNGEERLKCRRLRPLASSVKEMHGDFETIS